MVVEFFLLGCTGVVVFLHGANFFFHAITSHLAFRSLRFYPGRWIQGGPHLEDFLFPE